MEVKFAETRANDRATILAKNLQSGPNCIILRANEKKKKERKKEISSVVCFSKINLDEFLFNFSSFPFSSQTRVKRERKREREREIFPENRVIQTFNNREK